MKQVLYYDELSQVTTILADELATAKGLEGKEAVKAALKGAAGPSTRRSVAFNIAAAYAYWVPQSVANEQAYDRAKASCRSLWDK